MGRPVAADGPSLDRLKALKSPSSFDLQIREAQQLCTHSARADMILRWLLEQMKDSNDAIRTVQLWDTFQSTLRLLPFNRIAVLLSPYNILVVVERALAEEILAGEVFASIAGALRLLLELSEDTKGVAIKAELTLDAAAAAKFVQIWMRQCYHNAGEISQDPLIAVRIWNLRSPSADEHKSFSERCLLWVTIVLAKSQSVSRGTRISRKRKRNDSTLDVERDLQALIARHVILPGRTYYVNAQDQKPTKRSQSEQKHQLGLKQLLEPYKSVDSSLLDDEAFQTTWYAGVPTLLDIALRCVPAPTLRHRMQEQPWVEFVFSCFANCIGLANGTTIQMTQDTLLSMLSVIERDTTLSTETLRKVTQTPILAVHDSHVGSNEDRTDMVKHGASVNRVLYKIIELDASVFLDMSLLAELCTFIRNIDHAEMGEEDTRDGASNGNIAAKTLEMPHIVQRLVLAPIMRAFARERKLDAFVDMWYGQLQKCAELEILAAWEDLGDAFVASLETNLTEQQIVGLLDRFMVELEKSYASDDDQESAHMTATISILGSIVRGIQSEHLLDIVHDKIGALLKDATRLLMSTTEQDRSKRLDHSQIWTLCTSAFELWYPRWANTDVETAILEAYAEEVFSVKLIERACKVSSKTSTKSARQSRALNAAQQAATFIACLCHHLSCFKSTESAVQASMKQLVKRTRQDLVALPGLVCYPSIIMLMTAKQRTGFLDAVLGQAEGGTNCRTLTASIHALCAITTVLPVAAARLLIDDIIAAVSRRSNLVEDAEADGHAEYYQMITFFDALPKHVLTKAQCSRAVDTLTSDFIPRLENDQSQLELRLSLIIRLLADKSAPANICDNAFWTLAAQVDLSGGVINDHSAQVHVLLSRLGRLIMRQVLENQSREVSRKVSQYMADGMRGAVSSAQAYVEAIPAKTTSVTGTLAACDGIFQAVRDRGNQEIKDMFYQPKLLEDYIQTVSLSLDDVKKSAEEGDGSETWAKQLFESLIALQTTIQSFGLTIQANHIQKIINNNVVYLPPLERLDLHSSPDAVAIADEALAAMSPGTQPQQAIRVITKFRQIGVTKFTSRERTSVVNHLLSMLKAETTVSALELAHAALSAIEKNDQEENGSSGRETLLSSALQIAVSSKTATQQQAMLRFITTILREKPFLTNQSTIEGTVSCLQALADRPNIESVVYLELCSILTLLLQQYRSRISDRMHLVVGLLQALVTSLFQATKSGHVSLDVAVKPPTSRHAHALARCLQLFCSPPPPRPTSKPASKPSLVDSSRRAQAQVGQYVPYVLHHYCTQVLAGSPAPGVRDALKPGIWTMIEAMEINDESAVRTLSWAMNVSERAVLRGLYDDYKTTGKWSGN